MFVCVYLLCRDLAVIVASIAYNTWFTKLYCKDMRIVIIFSILLTCKPFRCRLSARFSGHVSLVNCLLIARFAVCSQMCILVK